MKKKFNQREYQRLWARKNLEKNREEINRKRRERYVNNKEVHLAKTKEYRESVRIKTLTYYSNGEPNCACCGEKERHFLSIDHIHGGGRQHRLRISRGGGVDFLMWLSSQGYPDGYQVLCMNCNTAKHKLGLCPHKKMDGNTTTYKDT